MTFDNFAPITIANSKNDYYMAKSNKIMDVVIRYVNFKQKKPLKKKEFTQISLIIKF